MTSFACNLLALLWVAAAIALDTAEYDYHNHYDYDYDGDETTDLDKEVINAAIDIDRKLVYEKQTLVPLQFWYNSTRMDVKVGNSILIGTMKIILENISGKGVNDVLRKTYENQCRAASEEASDFDMIINEKTACLKEVHDDVIHLVRANSFYKGLTIHEQVSSHLICTLLPEIISCHLPAITKIVGCTGDENKTLAILNDFQQVMITKHCLSYGAPMREYLKDNPSCLKFGIQELIKELVKENWYLRGDTPPMEMCIVPLRLRSAIHDPFTHYCGGGDQMANDLWNVTRQVVKAAGCSPSF